MVFKVSTYGEFGPSDDAIEFDKLLEKNNNGFKKENGIYLNQLNYSIFGLRSRKYEHFNAMAKKINKLLISRMYNVLKFLQRIYEQGECDDSKYIQSDFDK